MARYFRNNRAANCPIDGTALFFKCAEIYHKVYEQHPVKGRKLSVLQAIDLANALNDACFNMLREIAAAPALDVIPVVRCGNCRYYEERDYLCTHPEGLDGACAEYDYCPHGVRRERK